MSDNTQHMNNKWLASRKYALDCLNKFAPRAGFAYAKKRNFDFGTENRENISNLSPFIRHRLILEEEVLQAVLKYHDFKAAEKFIQEIFWRGYFKGWLEQRPDVWQRYNTALDAHISELEKNVPLARNYAKAVGGKTGIICFDAWVNELLTTGYLHNHARMWFASIWIFTLKLPWELGADFFFRNLLDGDPASNTCSWRWVGGLHTTGKTYLAQPSNIAKFTDGRFGEVNNLSVDATPLTEPSLQPIKPIEFEDRQIQSGKFGLLITQEDCAPHTLDLPSTPSSIFGLTGNTPRSRFPSQQLVDDFASNAVLNALSTARQHFKIETQDSGLENWGEIISDWCSDNGLAYIVTARPSIGPVASRLAEAERTVIKRGFSIIYIDRAYDRIVWPHAKAGFFGLKKKIPKFLNQLGLLE